MTATYGSRTSSRSASASQAGTTRRTSSPTTSVAAPATPPSSARASRWSRSRPATTALIPIMLAMLNRFEPTTTPRPTLFDPAASATIADDSSGASAPAAVRSPSSASGSPRCAPRTSSRRANTAAAARVATSETRNTATATGVDTSGTLAATKARVILLALLLALASPGTAAAAAGPRLLHLRVGNGSRPFAGDRALLTTVSPNGDGFRDGAVVRFRATEAATVELDALATDTADAGVLSRHVVFRTRARVRAGPGALVWTPVRGTPPRTYLLRLTVTDAGGRRRVYGAYGPGGTQNAPVVRVQGVDAGFTRRS